MPTIDQIIKINITRQTTAVPQAGFGRVLILSFDNNTDVTEAFRTYTRTSYKEDEDLVDTSEEYKALDSLFSQDLTPDEAYLGYVHPGSDSDNNDPTAALNRINLASQSGFYCVIPVGDATKLTDENLIKVADWTESSKRIGFFQTNDEKAYDSSDATDLGSVFKDKNYARNAVFFTKAIDDYVTAGIAGRCLPSPPGSIVFAYKELKSVEAPVLEATQITILDSKNYNYFTNFGGSDTTFNGKFSDGGFIDLIRDTDWLTSRVKEGIIADFINRNKIPYTDDGVNIILQTLVTILESAVLSGVISGGYTYTKQSVDDIPFNDRSNRKLPDIRVQGRYQGAIQSVGFDMTISV